MYRFTLSYGLEVILKVRRAAEARPIPRGSATLRASMGIEPELAERSPIIFVVGVCECVCTKGGW